MKKNEECKIVRDLLPSCIDKVTDEVTNEFIQKHIEECEECKKVLEQMGEEVILDKVKEKEKLDYLKKIKRKQTAKVVAVSFILTIITSAAIVFCAFMSTASLVFNENREPDYYRSFMLWLGFDIDEGMRPYQKSNIAHLVVIDSYKDTSSEYVKKYPEQLGRKIEIIEIITYNKETNICLSVKYCWSGYSKEEIEEAYKGYSKDENSEYPIITDTTIQDGKLMFTMQGYTGIKMEEIKEELEKSNKEYRIIEF